MKKICNILLIVLSISIITGCTKQEQKECPDCVCNCEREIVTENPKENQKESIIVKYNEKEITTSEALEISKEHAFEAIYSKVKLEILREEMAEHKAKAEGYVKETMKAFKNTYGVELLDAIIEYTDYKTIEEYQEYLELSYLEDIYFKIYVSQKEEISFEQLNKIDIKDYYKKYYIDSIKELFNKYNVAFACDDFNDIYEKYLNKLQEKLYNE